MSTNAEKALAASGATRMRNGGQTCPTCGHVDKNVRSYQQHKRYFALIRALHSAWPASHERQFATEEALRKWLQIRAGHHTTTTVDLYGIPSSKARLIVESALGAAAPFSETVVQGRNLVIFTPKSINYDTLGHKAFCELNNAVDEVVFAETGINCDQLLMEGDRAA